MARLYGEVLADRRDSHFIANESFSIDLYYGDREHSKFFCSVKVVWEKGTEEPTVEVVQK
jgi:hypothetical protein